MKQVISVGKMSKKAQKAYYSKKRNFWPINPVTQIVPDKKKYNRKAIKDAARRRFS